MRDPRVLHLGAQVAGAILCLCLASSSCGTDTAVSTESVVADTAAGVPMPPTPNEAILEAAEDIVAEAGIPGVAWSVVGPDGVVTSGAVGMADVAGAIGATPATPYLLASVSKPVLSTVVMRLVEQGQLDLDVDVETYVDMPIDNPLVDGETITLRALMTHTSGIVDGPAYESAYTFEGDSMYELGEYLRDYLSDGGVLFDPLSNFAATQPGETYDYSNVGVGLVGHIVESVTGRDLNDVAGEVLFDPAAMTDSGWRLADFDDVAQVATPYTAAATGFEPIGHLGHPTWPDGGLRASAADVGRWLATVGLHGATVLSETSINAMFDGELLWDASGDFVVHDGFDHGAHSLVALHRPTGVAIAVVTNTDQQSALDVFAKMSEALFEQHGVVFDFTAGADRTSAEPDERVVLDQAVAGGPGGVVVAIAEEGEPVSVLASSRSGLEEAVFPSPGATTVALAVVTLRLVEEGALSLDDRVAEIFGEHPYSAVLSTEIRVRDLLAHTTGLPQHPENLGPDATVSDLLEATDLASVRHPVGERLEFSNTNNLMLATLLESLTSTSIAGLMQEHVLDPAGMRDSGIVGSSAVTPVVGFVSGAADVPVATSELGPGMSHAGMLTLSVRDVVAFQQAIASVDVLLTAEQIDVLRGRSDDEDAGLGLVDLTDVIGVTAFGFAGDAAGYPMVAMHVADGSVAVVIAANNELIDVAAVADELLS